MQKKYSLTRLGNLIFATPRRGAGVVELARLESVYRRNPIKGSNPFPSAAWLGLTEAPRMLIEIF
jgi:hypothetical protein